MSARQLMQSTRADKLTWGLAGGRRRQDPLGYDHTALNHAGAPSLGFEALSLELVGRLKLPAPECRLRACSGRHHLEPLLSTSQSGRCCGM